MKHLRIVLIIAALCTMHYALCTTYYASPTGTGDGLIYATPCSFSNGLNKLTSPGDTLYLLGGQYDLGNTQIGNKNGSAAHRIVISGYPGEEAILDFRTTPYGTRGLQIKSTSSYLHIKDMTLRYSGKNNLYCEGTNCIFEHLDIYGSADTGCQMKNGGNNLIKNVDSHHNFDYEHYGSSGADFGGNADGFADKQHSGMPNHYIGCRSWMNSDDGWDFFQRVTTDETIIENCICYQNGPAEYDMRNHARYQVDKTWFDQINGQTITNRYGEQQVVSLQHYPCHGNGNGFKLGGGYTDHKVLVHHCLSVANYANGFDQNNNDGTMRIYNNTGYLNGLSQAQTYLCNFGFTTAYGTLYIQNNVSYQSTYADHPTAKSTLVNSHNSWNSMAAAASDFQSLDTTQILAPRQANGELAKGTLLRLSTGSKFIDAGEVVGLVYWNTAPDMGYDEVETGEMTDPNIPEPEYTCTDSALQIAYVSVAGAAADKALLKYLKSKTDLCITVLEASEIPDLTDYDLVILSPVPNSSAAGAQALQNTEKPFLCMKPFMGKNTVWNWCTPTNNNAATIDITTTTHPIFANLATPLTLYSKVTGEKGVVTMKDWVKTGMTTLATYNGQDAIVEGSNLVILGLSEGSMTDITEDGKLLVYNCIYHLLLRTQPTDITQTKTKTKTATKIITPQGVMIRRSDHIYTLTGQHYE